MNAGTQEANNMFKVRLTRRLPDATFGGSRDLIAFGAGFRKRF